MNNFDDNYKACYDQSALWDEYDENAISRINAILEWMPKEVEKVLDVGCGSGVLTNRLENTRFSVGVDISSTGLKMVHVPKLVCSADNLPFTCQSFDMVILTEVLEHLPYNVYEQSLSEVCRVSSRYILVAVPYEQDLEVLLVKCPMCGTIFSGPRHLRSFDLNDMKSLFQPQGFLFKSFRFFGHLVRRYYRLEMIFRNHILNLWRYPKDALCPSCGYPFSLRYKNPSESQNQPDQNQSISRRMAIFVSNILYSIMPTHPMYIFSLYEREEVNKGV